VLTAAVDDVGHVADRDQVERGFAACRRTAGVSDSAATATSS
jgi:hypothetical protein